MKKPVPETAPLGANGLRKAVNLRARLGVQGRAKAKPKKPPAKR